jgi:subtilisin family serine protease
LVAALEYAYTHGVLVVVAAGNQGQDASDVVPANCPYVLTVAATDISDLPADFTYAVASNYGQAVDVAAPGKSIYATWLETRPPYTPYAYLEGTSMATPFVGALAALVWAKYPLATRDAVTPDQVAAVILDTSLDLGASGWDQDYGCGRIRAAEAVITGTLGSQPVCRPDALGGLGALGGRGVSRWERLLKRQRWSPDAGALDIPGDYVPGRLVIGFKDMNDLPQNLKAEVLRLEWFNLLHTLDASVERQLPNGVVIARVTEGQEWAVAQQLFHNPLIAYVHPDYWISAR